MYIDKRNCPKHGQQAFVTPKGKGETCLRCILEAMEAQMPTLESAYARDSKLYPDIKWSSECKNY